MSLNSVHLLGNVTRDIDLRYLPSGSAVAELGLAVNRVYSTNEGERREEVTFVDVSVFGRQAEIAGEYLRKGSQVLIQGRLSLDVWDDKQTGQKRSKLKVVCERLHLVGGKRDDQGQGQSERPASRPAERSAARSTGRPAPPARPPADPDLDAMDEDSIPF